MQSSPLLSVAVSMSATYPVRAAQLARGYACIPASGAGSEMSGRRFPRRAPLASGRPAQTRRLSSSQSAAFVAPYPTCASTPWPSRKVRASWRRHRTRSANTFVAAADDMSMSSPSVPSARPALAAPGWRPGPSTTLSVFPGDEPRTQALRRFSERRRNGEQTGGNVVTGVVTDPDRLCARNDESPAFAGLSRCAEEDSNLHPVIPDQALNLARLPIPPSARGLAGV